MTERSPGGWCTNWSAFNVDSIWEMVAGEGDDGRWDQVHSWADIESVVNAHAKWLTAFQAEVERIWPSTGEASAAFARHVDVLKANMDQTVIASGRTKHALNDILTNLKETKAKIAEVRKDYAEASGDLVIRQIDGAEDELNEKARRIMAESENVVRQHTVSIVAPPTFKTAIGDLDNSGAGNPRGGTSGGRDPGSLIPSVRHDPPAPISGVDPVMPDGKDWSPDSSTGSAGTGGEAIGSGGGPVLSGMTPPSVIEPPVLTPNQHSPSGLSPTGGSNPLPGGAGPLIGGGPGMFGGGAPRGGGAGGTAPFGTRPTAGRPVGGVIGGAATGGAAGPRGRMSGMPANGVLGGNQGAGGPGGRGSGPGAGRGPAQGMPAGQQGRQKGSKSESDGQHWDPDNPWEVDEGGPAVIEPDLRQHRHDPGHGVIGSS